MPLKSILFDLDGTISDPATGIVNAAQYALQKLRLPPVDPETIRLMIGPPLQEGLRTICGIPATRIDEGVRLYREYYFKTGWKENTLYPGIRSILEILRDRGKSLAVATFKPEIITQKILEHFGIDSLFSTVAGAERSTDGTKSGIIAEALDKLNSAPGKSVMIGDRAADLQGAQAYGIRFIGVSWGYASDGELREADSIATNPEDLLALLV